MWNSWKIAYYIRKHNTWTKKKTLTQNFLIAKLEFPKEMGSVVDQNGYSISFHFHFQLNQFYNLFFPPKIKDGVSIRFIYYMTVCNWFAELVFKLHLQISQLIFNGFLLRLVCVCVIFFSHFLYTNTHTHAIIHRLFTFDRSVHWILVVRCIFHFNSVDCNYCWMI